MSIVFKDEFHGVGGSYEIRDGKRVRLDTPQTDHPDGPRARDADGNPHDRPEETAPALVAPTPEAAAEEPAAGSRRARKAE